jgi:hypothetical protein
MKRRNFVKTTLLTGAATTMSAGLISCETDSIATNSDETMMLPAKNVPLLGEYDVIVAGGGLGGVSAAVAAAKAGAKTLLVERNGFPGGVATAGMCSSVYNPLYTPSHELVVRGNSAMFIDRLAEANGSGKNWHEHLGHIIFDTECGKVVLMQLLQEAGCDYLLDTLVTDVLMKNNRLAGIVIDSKSGKQAIKAKAVVDATGDADVAYMAGAPCNNRTTKSSYCFRIGNVDVDKFVQYFIDNPGIFMDYMDINWSFKEALAHYRATGTFLFPHGGTLEMEIIKKAVADGRYKQEYGVFKDLDAVQMHFIRDLGTVGIVGAMTEIDALDNRQISKALFQGKEIAYMIANYFRSLMPGFENGFIIGLADDLGVRTTRWIDGDFAFTKKMKEEQTNFEDSIGKGVVQTSEKRYEGNRSFGVQILHDTTYDIPYRCLLPKKVDGLVIGAGRSTSQENPSLLRVMAMTMVVGQGAGAAAALSAKHNTIPRDLDISTLQGELKSQGVNV